MMRLPEGMHPSWDLFMKRIQSACSQNYGRGLLVIEMKVVVDSDGQPRFWTEPKTTRIEPRKSDSVLAALTND